MKKTRRLTLRPAYLTVVSVLCAWPAAAWAGQAAADLTDGYGNAKNNANATTALFASTYTGGPVQNTRSYNSSPSGNFFATSTRTAGVDNPDTYSYSNAAPGTALNAAFAGGPFSTVVGKNNLSKPTVAPKDDSPTATGTVSYGLFSQSGPYESSASNNNTTIYTFASKTAVNKVSGAAGSIAYDPFTLNPSSGPPYAYAPTLDGSLQLDDDTQSAELVFFATDSNIDPDIDNFVQDGQPLNETLWTLIIQAAGPISSVSSLSFAFDLNALALPELNLSSTPGYSAGLTSAQLVELVDSSVDAALANGGITVADGTASLTGFTPFAPGTTFTPALGSSEQIADGNESSIASVPEPGTLVLLAIGSVIGCAIGGTVSGTSLFGRGRRRPPTTGKRKAQ